MKYSDNNSAIHPGLDNLVNGEIKLTSPKLKFTIPDNFFGNNTSQTLIRYKLRTNDNAIVTDLGVIEVEKAGNIINKTIDADWDPTLDGWVNNPLTYNGTEYRSNDFLRSGTFTFNDQIVRVSRIVTMLNIKNQNAVDRKTTIQNQMADVLTKNIPTFSTENDDSIRNRDIVKYKKSQIAKNLTFFSLFFYFFCLFFFCLRTSQTQKLDKNIKA